MAAIDIFIVGAGDRKLIRKLDQLGDSVLRKVVRRATNLAMTPVLQDAKAHVRVRKDGRVPGGSLKRSLGKKTKTYSRKGVVVTIVGARRGFKRELNGRPVDPANYAHLVELGHRIAIGGRLSRKGRKGRSKLGRHGGQVRAYPFEVPALKRNQSKVLAIYRRELAAGVVREAQRGR